MTEQFSLSSNKNTSTPKISVVVCTRNRGNSVVPTLETIFSNTLPADEVILIDQSTNQETQQAIGPFRKYPQFSYYPSNKVGAGRARNDGIAHSKGTYILFTDDDCTVPPNWIEIITGIFDENPTVAVIFSNVDAGPHDILAGTIPMHLYSKSKLIQNIPQYYRSVGMGAGMSVRRESLTKIGVFDEALGPGSTFLSGEDHDFALRTLAHKWHVYESSDVTVMHHGFRTLAQYRDLTKRDSVAMGAVHAKTLKCGQWSVLLLVCHYFYLFSVWQPLKMIFEWKLPRVLKRLTYYLKGFIYGLQAPVDRSKMLYALQHPHGN